MIGPYEHCPVYENERYLLRYVDAADAPDLLRVYADEKALPFFNSDNCGGDDFHYTTLERMQKAIAYWQWEYQRRGFVRWTIFDKPCGCAVGTVELFKRRAQDLYDNCGILRLDLHSDHETTEHITAILSMIVPHSFALFDCRMLATKVPPFAAERAKAVTALGFCASPEPLIGGNDGVAYGNYYILTT